MPRHVAVIMDGNVRWERQRGLSAGSGHEAGFQAVREIINLNRKWGIRVLTVYMFSLDNWNRPKTEVQFYMSLVEGLKKSVINTPVREDIRLSVIGDSSKLPGSLQKVVRDAEEKTKDNTGYQLFLAVNYTGKYDVVQACKSISKMVNDGLIQVEDINESVIDQELETKCTEFPYPDLLIRAGGEHRLSNFMIWQLAYTELYFAPTLWPDFGKAEFAEALISFQKRERDVMVVDDIHRNLDLTVSNVQRMICNSPMICTYICNASDLMEVLVSDSQRRFINLNPNY